MSLLPVLLLVISAIFAGGCAGQPASLKTTAERYLRCPADQIEVQHGRGRWIASGCGQGGRFVCPLLRSCLATRSTVQARWDWCMRTARPGSVAQTTSKPRLKPEGTDGTATASPSRGSLPKEIIRRHMLRIVPSVRACFECALDRVAPNAPQASSVRITTKFMIGPSGRVLAADVEGVNDYPRLSACVVGAMREVSFPAPDGGGVVVVTYPWVFEVGP